MRLPRQDHYEIARDAAVDRLRGGLDAERLGRLGAQFTEDGRAISVPSLCWRLLVRVDPFSMSLEPDGGDVAIAWQILVLDYLNSSDPVRPSGFRSFADFAEGRGYQRAFDQRVVGRLSHTVGRDGAAFAEAARRLGAEPSGADPVRCIFRFFPLLEFQVARYAEDEDFPPSCNVLLSDNLLSIFTMEDGIVAAERLVSALEGKTPAAPSEGIGPT